MDDSFGSMGSVAGITMEPGDDPERGHWVKRNRRHLLVALVVLLAAALVSVAGFVGCGWRAPGGDPADPTVRGRGSSDQVVVIGRQVDEIRRRVALAPGGRGE